MATAFQQKLRQIAAAGTTNELNLRARRDAHAESLIFERDVAIKQDWDTLYEICIEGYRELRSLDTSLQDFESNLFSAHSKDQDREQFNKAQNEELDNAIEACLQILGARLSLRPGVRTLEWLIRRFRIHVYNVRSLLLTVLPLHESPLFQNVLTLIPAERLVDEWKFLRPYHKTSTQIPHHTVVNAATNNEPFFSVFNSYTLSTCRNGASHPVLMRFWGGIVVEVVAGRLNQAKSGRPEIQRQRTEDVLHKALPVLSEGLTSQLSSDLTLASIALSLVLATSGMLEDAVLDSLIEAVSKTFSLTVIETRQALTALVILAANKSEPLLPRKVLSVLSAMDDLEARLADIGQEYPTHKLVLGMIRSILKSMKKKDYEEKVALLRRLFQAGPSLNTPAELVQWLVAVVSEVQSLDARDAYQNSVRSKLIALLQDAQELPGLRPAFVQLATVSTAQGFDIEGLLQITITAPEPVPRLEDAMDVDEEVQAQSSLDLATATLPDQLPNGTTFLSQIAPPIFGRLTDVLRLCHKNDESLESFRKLHLWQSLPGDSQLYTSFLLRAAFSELPLHARSNAVTLLTSHVSAQSDTDAQNLLPYLSVLLSDPSPAIRKAASGTILAVHRAAMTGASGNETSAGIVLFENKSAGDITTLNQKQLLEVLAHAFLPHLEEFVSDAIQIRLVFQHALGGTIDQSLKSSSGDPMTLKKNVRQALFEAFAGHAIQAPLLRLKVGMINILGNVSKAGSMRKAEALLPILKQWAVLSEAEAQAWALTEGLQLSSVDKAMASLITVGERDSINRVLDFMEDAKVKPREELVVSVFNRIVEIWDGLPEHSHQPLGLKIYELALSERPLFARAAHSALRQLHMSTETLQALLEHATGASAEAIDQPPTKRRRRSSSQGHPKPSSIAATFRQTLPRLTIALELVDGCRPENHPALLPNLIDVLLFLRRAKDRLQAESPYLLSLCLGAILAIVDKLKTAQRPNVDWASIRADLVAECVRTTESPQVQTTALMLSASLASIAPEKVIHHIMPVFTFMGGKIIAREDQHSINVVNQAIDEIVPPLVASLKKKDPQNLFHSTKNLLSSFVAAFDHIPDQRKVPLFQRLLKQLGAQEFGFAVVAMLVKNQSREKTLEKFLGTVFTAFEPRVYLSTFDKLIQLARDVYATQPHTAESLIGITTTTAPQEKEATAASLLATAHGLITSKKLASRVAKMSKTDSPEAIALEEHFRECLRRTLESVQELRRHGDSLQSASRQCLIALLELVSVRQLIGTLAALLDDLSQTESNLKPQALRILATRLAMKTASDPATATAGLEFLGKLESIIRTTDDSALKFAAIECVDQICTKYGRRDVNALVPSVAALAGDAGLGSTVDTIRIVAALTIGATLDTLREAAVPVIPSALTQVFQMIEQSVRAEEANKQLHDPAFSLTGSIAHSIPFMISEEDLDRLVAVATQSVSVSLPETSNIARKEALEEVARNVDLDALTGSLSRTWDQVVKGGLKAVLTMTEMYTTAIEHKPKAEVIRSADDISTFLLQAFGLRQTQLMPDTTSRYSPSDIASIESELNALALRFIYKLSDTTFRPLFATWVEWATKARDLSLAGKSLAVAKLLRQATLTSFLEHFFSTLKSIVTSYASYLLVPANEALGDFSKSHPTDAASLALYSSLLAALRAAFAHDADTFFAAPSHFEPLAMNLVAQLHLASHKALRSVVFDQVIPTLVALASAVQDTPSHHLAINHYLAQLRHADSSYVRLASIRTHMAMTQDEEVGDEWVDNVVSGTASAGGLLGEEGEKAGVGGSGETMIYVNEMLEDDEEEVEQEVRRWVRIVRERVGEEIFET